MSSSKENLQRGILLSKQGRSLKNLYESSNFYHTMQNGFGQMKLLRKTSQKNTMQSSLTNFHKTIAIGEGGGSWVRPESKHANRNFPTRPETSKGSRKQSSQSIMMLSQLIKNPKQAQNITTGLHKTTTTGKKIFKRGLNPNPNKQSYNQGCTAQLGSKLMMFNNWQKYEPVRERVVMNQDEQNVHDGEIEIVVNRRVNKGEDGLSRMVNKKGPSMHRNKFETDLDDEFLELFAAD